MYMAARRSSSVCAFCQARQLALSRRRPISAKRRLQTAVAIRLDNDDGFFSDTTPRTNEERSRLPSSKQEVESWGLQDAAKELQELWKQRHQRLEVLRRLRNKVPEVLKGRREHISKQSNGLEEANAAPVPHTTFRKMIKETPSGKPMRKILRFQLLRCEYPQDILRIVAFAMLDRVVAENLALLSEPIMRALYRCRQKVSDPEVLRCLTVIIRRFEYAKLEVSPRLIFMGLKFAARSRSLAKMQRYLRSVREGGLTMNSNAFRAIIAKCSIGHRGLGEIRNGRWRQSELMQVLTGFESEKHLPLEEQNHLGTFLDRSDWQYLHGWIAVLARCKASEAVWHEWQIWKNSPSRITPRTLSFPEPGKLRQMTTKTRGDYWFVEQIAYAGDMKLAWAVYEETGVRLSTFKRLVKDKLLESVEHATVWNDMIRDEMIAKYDRDLAKIEGALGVKWVPSEGGEDGEGQHELYMDQEEALEKLGQDDWRFDTDYGYPWEDEPIVTEKDRTIHDAVEI